jgi:HlyD family secretion protein
MLSRLMTGAVLIIIAAAVAWALWPRPVEVEVATIGRGPLTVTVKEEGLSQIRDIFRVSAPVGGTLNRLTLDVGDSVTAGEVIGSIGPAVPALLDERARRVAQASLEAADAAVELAVSNLAQAEAQLSFATEELNRTRALAEKGLASTQSEQRTSLGAQTAQQGLAAAKATLLMRQRERESASAALDGGGSSDAAAACCTLVHAPIAGRVLAVFTTSELVVQPGAPLLDIGDPTDLEIVVEVLSSDAVRLAAGAAATIEDWGGPALNATVREIDPIAITKVSALGIEEQRARVVLDLLDPVQQRPGLGHGFRVVASIVLWQGEDILTLPMAALFRRGDAWAVFAVEQGRAVLREIQVGQRNDAQVEVLGGLSPGDTVILHPGDTIADGTAVVTPPSADDGASGPPAAQADSGAGANGVVGSLGAGRDG